ncbi:MAG: glycosyltransferase family 4 protein [Desulfobacula sp.]|nr:glycosyltransferase family 4 protein [Desulfobacula sp.]
MEKKICIISLKAYPLFNKACNSIFGGAEVQLFLLAQELVKNKKLGVNFIVADYGQKSYEKYDGIIVTKSFGFGDFSLIKYIKFFNIFMRINADVYIQRTLDPASGIIAIVCKLLRKRFIYMVAADKELDEVHNYNNGRLKALFANLAFRYADVIIVQNINQKNLLQKNKGRDSFLIKSGYSMVNSRIDKDDYILWVGRSEKVKRPDLFIKLAKENPSFEFKMVCPKAFSDSIDNYHFVQQSATKHKNLEFIEYVPFNEIEAYFQKARIFVNTSDREGFPNAIIQAAMNGTPIISLNVNPDNFLNESMCGFFCNGDFSEMNERLNQILNDVNLYNKMSESIYKYAKENHDITKNTMQFYNLIKDEFYAKK